MTYLQADSDKASTTKDIQSENSNSFSISQESANEL